MDRLDVLIFRELFRGEAGEPLATNPRKSFRAIARSLGIDELTVSDRLKKLRKTGFLKGWVLLFNPTLFRIRLTQLLIDVLPKEKDELAGRLGSLESVVAVVEHLGPSIWAILASRDEPSRLEQISLVGSLGGKAAASFDIPFPPTELSLSPTDIEIIEALSRDPRRMYSEVANELGLSTRTLKRRLLRMIDAKAVFSIPSMNPGALEGVMLGDLLVRYSKRRNDGAVNRELLSNLDDCLIRPQLGDPHYAFANLFVTRVSSIRETLERVRSINGVTDARLDIVQSRMEFFERYSAIISRALSTIL